MMGYTTYTVHGCDMRKCALHAYIRQMSQHLDSCRLVVLDQRRVEPSTGSSFHSWVVGANLDLPLLPPIVLDLGSVGDLSAQSPIDVGTSLFVIRQ